MKPRFQAKNGSSEPSSDRLVVTSQSRSIAPVSSHRHQVEAAEEDIYQELTDIIQEFQHSGRHLAFEAHDRHLVRAAATLSAPVVGLQDNCLQYQMTTRDGLTVYLREWLKPDNGTPAMSRKHPNTTQSVLLMPGFPHAGMIDFKFQVTDPTLTKRFRLITMEVRGQGDSSKPTNSSDYTQQKQADDVQDAITLLQLFNPVLASCTGFIIMNYLNVYGQGSIGGIVLVAAATKIDLTNPAFAAEVFDPAFVPIIPSVFNLNNDLGDYYRANHQFIDLSYYNPVSGRQKDDCAASDMYVPPNVRIAILFPPYAVDNTVLGTITKPCLVVHAKDNCASVNGGTSKCTGTRDNIVRFQHAVNNYNLLKQHSPKTKFKIMDGVGHCLQSEDPTTFNATLASYLLSL